MRISISHHLRTLLPLIAVAALATGAAALDGPAAPKQPDQKPAVGKATTNSKAAKSKAAGKKARVAAKRKSGKSNAAGHSKSKTAASLHVPTTGSVTPPARATLASAIATGPVPPAFAAPGGLAPDETDAVKRAVALAKRGRTAEASEIERSIRDSAGMQESFHAWAAFSYGIGYRYQRGRWGLDTSVFDYQYDPEEGMHSLVRIMPTRGWFWRSPVDDAPPSNQAK